MNTQSRCWLLVAALGVCVSGVEAQELYLTALADGDYPETSASSVTRAYTNNDHFTVLTNGQGVGGIALDPEGGRFYWYTSGAIWRLNLEGEEGVPLPLGNMPPVGDLTIDAGEGKVYWYYHEHNPTLYKIMRANTDGSGMQTLLTFPNNSIGRLAIDPLGQKIYWAGGPQGTVERANLDGTGRETLFTFSSGTYVEAIATHPTAELIFFATCEVLGGNCPADIYRANLDGSQPEIIVPSVTYGPWDLEVDPGDDKLYWTGNPSERVNLDGSDREELPGIGLYLAVLPKPAAVCQTTPLFADIVAPFADGGTQQPDILDIGALVGCFKQVPACDAALRAKSDLYPCYPYPDECLGNGGLIDFLDISAGVNAFKGMGCP